MKKAFKGIWTLIKAIYNLFIYPGMLLWGLLVWWHEIRSALGWEK